MNLRTLRFGALAMMLKWPRTTMFCLMMGGLALPGAVTHFTGVATDHFLYEVYLLIAFLPVFWFGSKAGLGKLDRYFAICICSLVIMRGMAYVVGIENDFDTFHPFLWTVVPIGIANLCRRIWGDKDLAATS